MGNREMLQGLVRLLPELHHLRGGGRGDVRRLDAAGLAADAGERLARDGQAALSTCVATALLLGVLPELPGAGAALLRTVRALDLLLFLRPEQIERLAGWALDYGPELSRRRAVEIVHTLLGRRDDTTTDRVAVLRVDGEPVRRRVIRAGEPAPVVLLWAGDAYVRRAGTLDYERAPSLSA